MAARARPNLPKISFFLLVASCILLVLWVDERFLFLPHDPEWRHIAPFEGKLLVHGVLGAAALLIGPLQFSERLRTGRPGLHRWMGRTYVGAVLISAPLATWIGFHFEKPFTAPEQIAQGGLWFLCTLMGLLCALKRQFAPHRLWMMRSYGFCLIFVASRVPDALPGFTWNDALLAHTLWWMIAAALVAPDLILTARSLAGVRRRV